MLTPSNFGTLALLFSTALAIPLSGTTHTKTVKAPAVTTTITKTIFSGAASTSYAFARGESPSSTGTASTVSSTAISVTKRHPLPQVADLKHPSFSNSTTITVTITPTHTANTKTTVAPLHTETVYPCSSNNIVYGTAANTGEGYSSSQNSIYGLDTDAGADAVGCCNQCLFGMENCVQAWWYFYEGCVVQQAVNVTSTAEPVSEVCPSGTIEGLTYGNNSDPAFRSTGNIVGPCGGSYVLE